MKHPPKRVHARIPEPEIWYEWADYDGRDGLADQWRRERVTRALQLIQCWLLIISKASK